MADTTAKVEVLCVRPLDVGEGEWLMCMRAEDVLEQLREGEEGDVLKEAILHELNECWLVLGERVRDPHVNARP